MAGGNPLFDALKAFFEQEGEEFVQLEGQEVLQMRISSPSNSWWLFAAAPAGTGLVVLQSVVGLATPNEKLPQMAELLHRLNFGMPVAKFELDYSDGEVRCTTGADLVGVADARNAIRNLARVNRRTMTQILPALFALILEDVTVEGALAIAKGSGSASAPR